MIPPDDPKKALNNESGHVEIARVKPQWDSGKWSFEEVPGTPFVRIKNKWKSTYLADRGGRLRAVQADEDAEESHWSFEPVDGTTIVQLRNRATEKYLLTVGGEAALAADLPREARKPQLLEVVSSARRIRSRSRDRQ